MLDNFIRWEERFADFCAEFAKSAERDELRTHYDIRELIKTKADARRFVCTARRVIRELEYAIQWAESQISENC